jgi:quinol monooxygenase YgiN
MYGLHGKIRAQAGQREALLALFLNDEASLNSMEGCYLYLISSAVDDADAIWITEVWRSQADHQASLANEAVRALITAARPLIADMTDRSEFTPLGGKGLAEIVNVS